MAIAAPCEMPNKRELSSPAASAMQFEIGDLPLERKFESTQSERPLPRWS